MASWKKKLHLMSVAQVTDKDVIKKHCNDVIKFPKSFPAQYMQGIVRGSVEGGGGSL